MSRAVMEEPARIKLLPHDKIGRPVPWFVAWINGLPEFRIVKRGALETALDVKRNPATRELRAGRNGCCWVCGFPFLRQELRCFVIGPMCAVNHISSEPPSHYECATYSAVMCPFLANPNMVRREHGLPEGTVDPGGIMELRNPGVTLVWTTKYNSGWGPTLDPAGRLLVDIGPALRTAWYCRGRPATREEVVESIDTGLPAVYRECKTDAQREDVALRRSQALELVPA